MQVTLAVSNKQRIIWYIIFAQALIAMLGSLYLSNFGDPVRNIMEGVLFDSTRAFNPCHLCWWARILMYPIVLISFVGILKKDKRFTDYILPLAIPGVALTMYHYSLQMFPADTGLGAVCDLTNPCSAVHLIYLDFITIPFMALVAFCVILALSIANWNINRRAN